MVKTAEKQSKVGWTAFFKLIKQTNPSKWALGTALSMSIVSTLASLGIPLLTKNLINHFSQMSMSPKMIAALIGAFIFQAAASGLSIFLLARVGQQVVAGLRNRLWEKLIRLPVYYFDRHRTGDMISRMTNDTGIIKDLITQQLANFFTGIISIIGSLVILFYLDWKMTAIMMIAVPLTIAVIVPLGRQMHKISKGLQEETASFTTLIQQVLSEIRLVKSSNAEPLELEKGKQGIGRLFGYGVKEATVQAIISPIMSLVLMILLVVILGYGALRIASGALTSGDLVAFILYLFQIIMPMVQFTMFFTQLNKAKGATDRIIDTLRQDEERYQIGEQAPSMNEPIYLENVSFAYKEGEEVLHQLNLAIEPGKVTAIVGPSGAGKTTLFSLLERFYEPTQGSIKLGETDIKTIDLVFWRSRIGYVAQDSPMIAGTISENIRYGIDRKINDEEIEEAARLAYADRFIRDFPNGYETEVGERGIKLSGGQKQRIGIARALLRDPKLLMLDEATASLDSQSEEYVQKALEHLMKNRTTIVIAHRLSTVVDADRIVFIEKGRITGTGTHDELYRNHRMYREFANRQFHIKDDGRVAQ